MLILISTYNPVHIETALAALSEEDPRTKKQTRHARRFYEHDVPPQKLKKIIKKCWQREFKTV